MAAKLYNKPALKNIRKELRDHLTPSEAALWNYLQDRKLLGRKFRRQASIGNYIVDFYCPQEKLAVELDGEVHVYDSIHSNDIDKENFLKQKSIKVVRFENKFVYHNLEKVLKIIISCFTQVDSH